MDISLLNILHTVSWDFRHDMAQNYANALKSSIEIHLPNDTQKRVGYFLSKKGTKSKKGNFQDKLYVGNIHAIERHLYWNDEELADDDQVIDVVYIDGPVTRDGGACTYGTKDFRDQVLYANTIPQVIGHLFIINTPGGETDCRKDYDLIISDCRAKGKHTVAFVDGMCCSSGVNLASRCDRTVVMNPKDDYGCIGSMAAFWATPDGAVDQDGSRYVEIVGDESPEKNDWWREAAAGDYEKLRALVNKDTNDFIDTVRENRPLVEDSMLTGVVFEAQEVMPALVDEIGDLNRAIECVSDLASGKLTAARFAEREEGTKTDEQPEEGPKTKPKIEPEPEKDPEPDPNEQPIPEGPEDEPEIDHKSENNMTEEEKKTLQAAEQPKAEKPEEKPNEKPGENPDENPDDVPNGENPTENPDDVPEGEDPDENPDDVPEGEKPDDPKKKGKNPTGNPDEDPDGVDNGGDGDGQGKEDAAIKAILADHDKKIAAKDKAIAERDTKIAELQAQLGKSKQESDDAIAQLKKQVADLRKEVKELASEPTPMAEGAEVPKDNGTGAPETGAVKSIINADMSADEIRKRLREQDKAIAAKRRRM